MDVNEIFINNSTLEDLYDLHEVGYDFPIEDGVIKDVLYRRSGS